ncbi:uncharacterized protein EMH_0085420 [Eimeria mitis]|uniref:Uncharacterized protein n=1 Tax=Eimeria mitis TaxID=44415 RepID=U6K719_9EIME|nr:uncharacterized protein EMH_0085420 [Eimeria mitis]CDJ33800.1 hypothetical protein EMH_0085420 [Eimeria mitis]
MKVSGKLSVCWVCGWVGGSAEGRCTYLWCVMCARRGIRWISFACRRVEVFEVQGAGNVFVVRACLNVCCRIWTDEGVGEAERLLDVRLGGWFSPRERGRVQEPQKVGSAVAIAVAIALRVVEVVELQGRRRDRVQAPQKVGSAVAIAIAIALRVVEVVELQGRRGNTFVATDYWVVGLLVVALF